MVGAALLTALFLFQLHRFAFLCDDAFISFCYSRNLAEGAGLTWSTGERVEGYTNFLWVMLVAGLLKTGIPAEVGSQLLGALAGVVTLLAASAFGRFRAAWGTLLSLGVIVLLAGNRSFVSWSSGGLETQLFTALLLLAMISSVLERNGKNRGAVSAIAAGAATLTRPEGVLVAVVIGAVQFLDAIRGQARWRPLIRWSAIFAGIVGAHLLFRLSYYGEWLPNTFYAKVNGFWPSNGARYFLYFHRTYGIGWCVPFAILSLFGPGRSWTVPFSTLLAVYGAYVFAIGGDHFEFRFLVPILPILYLTSLEGGRVLVIRLRRFGRIAAWAGAFVMFTLIVLPTLAGSARPEVIGKSDDFIDLATAHSYGTARMVEGRILRTLIDAGLLPDDLLLCLKGAGAVTYYTRLPVIDFHGLNDKYVARLPITERGVVGHEKRAPMEYLDRLGVEMFDEGGKLIMGVPQPKMKIPRPEGTGRWRYIRYGRAYINFVTFLSDEEIERRFGRLEVLP